MRESLLLKCPEGVTYRLDPDSIFPLKVLLSGSGMHPAEMARRCGYVNVAKGVRRINALADGELSSFESMRLLLAEALDIGIHQLDAAAADTRYIQWARRDRVYRRDFEPHVIWKTTSTVPRPIAVAGMIGASRGLRYLPATRHALKISSEAIENCPDGVACYGQVTGFYVNYSPDHAVEFDRQGTPLAVLDAAVRAGAATSRINSRTFTLSEQFKD